MRELEEAVEPATSETNSNVTAAAAVATNATVGGRISWRAVS